MSTESYGQRSSRERRGGIIVLTAAIKTMNDLARKASNVTPAKAVFGSARILLTTIRDSMVNELDYVELGLWCADVCGALDRVMNRRKPDELGQSVYDAMNLLALIMVDIRRKLVKRGERDVVSRLVHARNDKKAIATWRLDLGKILQVFNNELATTTTVSTSSTVSDVQDGAMKTSPTVSIIHRNVMNVNIAVPYNHFNASKATMDSHGQEWMSFASTSSDSLSLLSRRSVSEIRRDMGTSTFIRGIHRTISEVQDEADVRHMPIQARILGEFPPPPPRVFFGRDALVEGIVYLAENLTPIALTGPGGIGKTSVALAVLHHDRIKRRFGIDRRFIQCDQFPTTFAHFLRQLSKVIGAGIENPTDLTSLRTFLSSKEMAIVLDNAESILDPFVMDAREIYGAVEELGRFDNIWVCITSSISTTPPEWKCLDVPTLSMDAACETFYQVYDSDDRSNQSVNDILEQLDFHPLSVTLLATVAHQRKWDIAQMIDEWERQRTRLLCIQYNKSLGAIIERSLASPMFQRLGPDARALIEVTAFLPQGVNTNNLNWLFLTVPNATNIFDKFCVLSLAYRSNGFITMLAPLQDYLSPEDPKSSQLLRMVKERYFTWISISTDPDVEGARWVMSEDANVGRLLDVFTTIDANPEGFWNACVMRHPSRHRRRLTVPRPRVEELPDGRWTEPECFRQLSQSFHPVRNLVECKRLLTHAWRLRREQGRDDLVARILMELSHINHHMDLHGEGIRLEIGALNLLERLDDTVGQAQCLVDLALWWEKDDQLDLAEEAASRAVDLLPEEGREFLVCESHGVLGNVYQSKGQTEKAIHHFEVVLGIAPLLNRHDHLFWIHYCLAELFLYKGNPDEAHAHAQQAESYAVNSPYDLSCAIELQAWIWYDQDELEEARSEVLRAADAYEELGAAESVMDCGKLLRWIEEDLGGPAAFG